MVVDWKKKLWENGKISYQQQRQEVYFDVDDVGWTGIVYAATSHRYALPIIRQMGNVVIFLLHLLFAALPLHFREGGGSVDSYGVSWGDGEEPNNRKKSGGPSAAAAEEEEEDEE